MASSAEVCKACAPGRFSTNTSGECIECTAGRYGVKEKATSLEDGCDPCAAGKFQDGTGKASIGIRTLLFMVVSLQL